MVACVFVFGGIQPELLERYLAVEALLNLRSVDWEQPRSAPHPVADMRDAEDAARSVREDWGLGNDPIPQLAELLEERGIKVLSLDLDNVDAAAVLQASNAFLKQPSRDFNTLVTEASGDGLLAIHHYKNYFTPIASGSFLTAGMVICPCSGSTLSGIAHAASQNLIQRAADVHLKEHRKLIVVTRETPLSVFQLENMHRVAQAGAVVLPAAPGWYHGATELVDLVDFVVARILDQFDVTHTLMRRWKETAE